MGIPISRIFEKIDELFDKGDFEGVERTLLYWENEAKTEGDLRGHLVIANEKMGFYRKQANKEKALQNVELALSLVAELGMENSMLAGTTYLNSATVYKAFGNPQKSVDLFQKAEKNYNENLKENDSRFGGLYNNMGLTYADLGQFERARKLFFKAIEVMKNNENGEGEQAISWLNIADTYDKELGEQGEAKVTEALTVAEALLNTKTLPQNGYTAYIFEKCAPVYGFYGWFATENELNERAKKLYERS